MKGLCILLTLATVGLIPALSQKGNSPFAGRWAVTVTTAKDTYPAWMELVEKDGNPQVRVQGRVSNVRPAAAAKMDGSRLFVTVSAASPAQPASGTQHASPARPEVTWELTVKGGKLTGSQKQGGIVDAQLAGVRAPALKRAPPTAWTDPEPLFNGKDLTGWEVISFSPHVAKPLISQWVAKNGELVNQATGLNLRTARKFDDFKLHVEFNLTAAGNSGIYLRGRYEVQTKSVAGGPGARNPITGPGSIYGFIAPSTAIPAKPEQWQSYDITLIGRNVTVDLNGARIIENQEIPGITGGALDSKEGEPGPMFLQGDHSGGIRFRNITVSVPAKR